MIQINYRLEALYEIKLQLNGKLSVGNLGTSVLSSKGNTPDDRSPLTILRTQHRQERHGF
jgi:hypothetical protein